MDRSTAFSLVDADVHNYPNALADLMPFLSARWQAYAKRLGLQLPGVSIYPKVFAAAARRDLCPHQGARLSDSHLTGHVSACVPGDDIRMERTGEVVVCPWHGWEFEVQTGRSLCDPQKTRVRSYVTRVEHGRVFVEMD